MSTHDAQAAAKDYLNMSDEAVDSVELPTHEAAAAPVDEVAAEVQEPVSNQQGEEGEVAADSTASADAEENAIDEGSADPLKGGEDSGVDTTEGKQESNPESKAPESATPEPVDYKAIHDRLMAPFKANGREIAVKDVNDAIALMQMGANYNKKMAALKPNLKLMKLLENNGLLNEERISFLIDLEKKNPEAISKLVKDSGLDPLDLDADKAGDYKPNAYTVDDREMELDTVLDELQGTPTYNQTLNIVSNVWDGASKQVIANSPQLLKVINSHVQSGIYDLIHKELESERMFGRLDGLSDIEAYRQIGDAIQARGGFSHLGTPSTTAPAAPVIVQPKPKIENEDKLREKKRAAGSTKPAVATQARQDYNPLSLSDDAFSKLVNEQYL